MQIVKEVTVINIKGVRYLTIPLVVRSAMATPAPNKYLATFTVTDDTFKKLVLIKLEDAPIKENTPPSTPLKEKGVKFSTEPIPA